MTTDYCPYDEVVFIKSDTATRQYQTREVRDGDQLLMQYRLQTTHEDGKVEYTDWKTTVIVTNYGRYFDKKLSLFERIRQFLGV